MTGADYLVTAIVTILIFLILISLHEFGHFIMAKATGVPVLAARATRSTSMRMGSSVESPRKT